MSIFNRSTSTSLIARNTLMLYIRMFLVMGVSLYTSRIVLSQLGAVDYGIYGVVGGIIVMLSFLNGAMSMSRPSLRIRAKRL